ncbi:hypothetical protein KSP40_PGU012271 [Platanthera guangdongensis]|uniref:Uncharacterized protein n=1 Tax=Platanthera guangdongensis TaxID=2320717 RepID=A0ABR2MZR2_9ASPA
MAAASTPGGGYVVKGLWRGTDDISKVSGRQREFKSDVRKKNCEMGAGQPCAVWIKHPRAARVREGSHHKVKNMVDTENQMIGLLETPLCQGPQVLAGEGFLTVITAVACPGMAWKELI